VHIKAGSLLVSSLPAGPDIAHEARQRRDRIKLLLTSMAEQTNKVVAILEQAQTNEDHLALGHKSWTAYIAGEYAGLLEDLNRAASQLSRIETILDRILRNLAPLAGAR